MSGKKQHFIPQSLLRGFGTSRKKSVYVKVFPYNREVFEVATDGIAAMRYFYSDQHENTNEKNLDEIITEYENVQRHILHELREQAVDDLIDPDQAAELVTHLSVRNAHFRDAMTSGAGRMFDEVTGIFQDRDRSRRALGLDQSEPSEVMLDAFNEQIERYRETFEALGMSDDQVRKWAWEQAKPLFEKNFEEFATSIRDVNDLISPEISGMGATAQIKALKKDLAPEKRTNELKKFNWKFHEIEDHEFILSDCVAVAFTPKGALPASMCGAEDTNAVVMPLSSNRLLYGYRSTFDHDLRQINEIMASCGWDFFIARTLKAGHVSLHRKLRSVTAQFFEDVIAEVADDY